MSEEKIQYEAGLAIADAERSLAGVDEARSIAPAITPGLARRLYQATKAVEVLTLDGQNLFHNYRYPTIAQVRQHANHALAGAGISIIPSVVRIGRHERTSDKGKTINITAVELSIAVCSEDGSYLAAWTGESEDTGDKGIQKAVSAGVKAFLSNLLMMPVAEDENDDEKAKSRRESAPRDETASSKKIYDAGDVESAARRPQPTAHWIDRPEARRRFWSYVRETLVINDSEVHAALGVESLHDYAGTMQDAKAALDAFVARKAALDQHEDDELGEGEASNASSQGANDEAAG
jgi:hypothetical protein